MKGDCWQSWDAAWSISGSGDLYGGYYSATNDNYAGYNSCVNFLTCHDGFTLYDLYSYNEKHNEANGWNNTDGANDNRSWNCGEEGETSNPDVLSLRYRMIRNACAVLLCSRGTPMFLSGDEFGSTKFGNNNSYCQDNEISCPYGQQIADQKKGTVMNETSVFLWNALQHAGNASLEDLTSHLIAHYNLGEAEFSSVLEDVKGWAMQLLQYGMLAESLCPVREKPSCRLSIAGLSLHLYDPADLTAAAFDAFRADSSAMAADQRIDLLTVPPDSRSYGSSRIVFLLKRSPLAGSYGPSTR